jgi:uncharacterized protein (DUF2141 family)
MSTKASELAQYGVNIDADRFLKIPSVTTTERDTISAVPGMLIYNSSVGVLQQYIGDSIWVSIAPSAAITSVVLPGSQTAVFTGDTITINGISFDSGAIVSYIDNSNNETSAPSSTRVSASLITATIPALGEGTYDVVVTNGNGSRAVFPDAFDVDGTPIFNTASGSLGSLLDRVDSANFNAGATEDGAAVNVSITSGALPNGLSISAQGIITGTPNTDDYADTVYRFTVTATDSENQTSDRNFSITVLENYVQAGSTTFGV